MADRTGRTRRQTSDFPDVLTAEQAALLQVSSKTVKRRAHAGEIPGRRVGNQWRFSRHALLAWLTPHEH